MEKKVYIYMKVKKSHMIMTIELVFALIIYVENFLNLFITLRPTTLNQAYTLQ